MKKEEIGELFHKHLQTAAGASDPQYLAEVARQHLRHKFMEADAGLTGVNFAVAETGGFVVCTNEGNADLGVSLPKLHIASMGIEKLIPRAKDLGVFLRLLARSATGQPITTYSSHFHGPRPGGELHIVIVDNGRSQLLASEEFRGSLKCIRCGACMNTCPVYRRSGGYSYENTVSGPDWVDFSAGPRSAALLQPAAGVQPVRQLHGRVPGEDRYPSSIADLAARAGGTRPFAVDQTLVDEAGQHCAAHNLVVWFDGEFGAVVAAAFATVANIQLLECLGPAA